MVQGIAWELYVKSKAVEGLPVPDYRQRRPVETPGYYSYINVPVYASVAEAEALAADVILHYHEFVAEVTADGDWCGKSSRWAGGSGGSPAAGRSSTAPATPTSSASWAWP